MIIHSDQWGDALKNITEGRKDAPKERAEDRREPGAPEKRTDERGDASRNKKEGDSLEKQTTPFRKLIKRMPGYISA